MVKLRDIIIIVVIALAIFLVTRLVIQNYVVEGPSMEPNLETGQWVLVNKVVYKLHPPQRGDIVVLNSISPPPPVLIKRVIGLPGEKIEIKAGKVYIIDDQGSHLLEESYIDVDTNKAGSWEVPEGHYFVMGDNRPHSADSRTWGSVPVGNIVGKAWLRIWPLSAWGLAPNYTPELVE